MYIVLAIIAFSLLIAVHELGHFTAAKLMKVRVNEFAIGMGPKLLKKQGKETLYSLRAFPFGGFCTMEGQDEDSPDPRAFTSQKRWRRVIILFAGSFANFIFAYILILILTAGATGFVSTTITNLADGFPNAGEQGLMAGDTIISLNGERLYYSDDFLMFMGLAESRGDKNADIVIIRNGEKIEYKAFPLEQRDYTENGVTRFRYGITFGVVESSVWENIKFATYRTTNFVRLVRVSIAQLFSGAAGVRDLSGPVGIVGAINSIGQSSRTFIDALENIIFFTAFIGVNLAVMNMLPIPALDGGRILFIAISWAVEKIIRRKLNPKYEGYIHTGAMVLLLGFMVFIMVNDVVKLIYG